MIKLTKFVLFSWLALLPQGARAAVVVQNPQLLPGNLSITAVAVSPAPICAGELVSFTVTVLNTGPQVLDAGGVGWGLGGHQVGLVASTPTAGAVLPFLQAMGPAVNLAVGDSYTTTVLVYAPADAGPAPWIWTLELQASYYFNNFMQLMCVGCPPLVANQNVSQRWPLSLKVQNCLPQACSSPDLPGNKGMEAPLAPRGLALEALGHYDNWYVLDDTFASATCTFTAHSGNRSLRLDFNNYAAVPWIRIPNVVNMDQAPAESEPQDQAVANVIGLRPIIQFRPMLNSWAIQDLCVDASCPATLCFWSQMDYTVVGQNPLSGSAKVSLVQLDAQQRPIAGAASLLLSVSSTAWAQTCVDLGGPAFPFHPALASLRIKLYGEAAPPDPNGLYLAFGGGSVLFDDFSLSQPCPLKKAAEKDSELISDKGAYPVPFKDKLHLAYDLKADAELTLDIYTVAGEPLFKQVLQARAGVSELTWLGENQAMSRCSAGVYLIHLKARTPGGRTGGYWKNVAILR